MVALREEGTPARPAGGRAVHLGEDTPVLLGEGRLGTPGAGHLGIRELMVWTY